MVEVCAGFCYSVCECWVYVKTQNLWVRCHLQCSVECLVLYSCCVGVFGMFAVM